MKWDAAVSMGIPFYVAILQQVCPLFCVESLPDPTIPCNPSLSEVGAESYHLASRRELEGHFLSPYYLAAVFHHDGAHASHPTQCSLVPRTSPVNPGGPRA